MSHASQSHRRFASSSMAIVFALTLMPALRVSAQDAATPCERYGTYPVTFVGVAGAPIWRRFTVGPDVAPIQLFVTPMAIERAYRGIDTSFVYLKLDSRPALEMGRRYLVYGHTNFGNAREVVSPGLPLEPVENAAADLAFLDAAALSQSGGTIFGTLSAGRMDDTNWPRTPLAGVAIRFVSDGSTTETVTADDGRFVVTGLPEGLVRIEPLLPDGWRVGSRGTEARPGGCTRFNLVVELNGRVRGRVLHPDGTPMTWMVDLLPVDPGQALLSTQRMSIRANNSGDFEFVGLRPGAYLIGVNLLHPASPAEPYPPTYFPGVINRNDAVPIVIGNGTVHEGVDLTLHDPILKGQLEILVESDAGPGEASVCLRNISSATGTGAGMYPLPVTGEPVTITVLDGARYQLLGHVERRDGHSESEVVDVTGTAARQTLTLRANGRASSHPTGFNCAASFSR